jgi:superfamily II DNA/RNA helicase
MSFKFLGLTHSFTDKFLTECGIQQPTTIQKQVIPQWLKKKSVLAISETGSGKTLAYILPIIERLKVAELATAKAQEIQNQADKPVTGAPKIIVLAPTRELAEQIFQVFKSYSHHAKFRVRLLTGGSSFQKTQALAREAFDILVATPSRLKSTVKRAELNLGHVQALILDEADNLIEMGFRKDIELFFEHFDHTQLQVGFFSATLSQGFEEFMLEKCASFKLERLQSQALHRPQTTISTYTVRVNPDEKNMVVKMFLEKEAKGSGLVFTNQRNQAEALYKYLADKMPTLKMRLLHGEMPIEERRLALEALRAKKIQVLVCTDVAARGIDVPDLFWVVNYGLPKTAIYYLHRAGRVGRSGRPGVVYNLVASHDQKMVEAINQAISEQTHLPLTLLPKERQSKGKPPKKPQAPQAAPTVGYTPTAAAPLEKPKSSSYRRPQERRAKVKNVGVRPSRKTPRRPNKSRR